MSEENMSMDDFSQAVDASFNTFKDEDQMAWEKVKQYREEKTVLTVTVDGIVNKGVVSYVEGIRGFIPASRLALGHVADLNEYLGCLLRMKRRPYSRFRLRLQLKQFFPPGSVLLFPKPSGLHP